MCSFFRIIFPQSTLLESGQNNVDTILVFPLRICQYNGEKPLFSGRFDSWFTKNFTLLLKNFVGIILLNAIWIKFRTLKCLYQIATKYT